MKIINDANENKRELSVNNHYLRVSNLSSSFW